MQVMDYDNAGYDMLAVAVVERAVEDWRYLCRVAEDKQDELKTYRLIYGRERDSFYSLMLFFKSKWCGTLCGEVDSQKVINRMEYERKHAKYKPPKRGRKGTMFTCFGKSMTLSEWSEKTGISETALRRRLKRGWPLEKALSTKKRSNQYENGGKTNVNC